MLKFELLRTPRADGEVLIEPAVPLWAELLEANVRRQAEGGCRVRLAGTPIDEVRRATRDRLFGPDCTEPIVACGHQSEFAHSGVWAKHVVVRHVASQLDLHGVDLVVDNDAPRSTALVLPRVGPDGLLQRQPLPVLSGPTGAANEARPPLSPTAIDRLRTQTAEALGTIILPGNEQLSDKSLIGRYFDGMASVERPRDFVEQHLAGREQADRPLQADLHELRVSQAFDGLFVADILLDLERFAREYNASLGEYRREQHVRSPDRPLPDLKRSADRLEAPFWIYQPLQQRRRLWVSSRADAVDLFAGDERAGTLSREDLARNPSAALASLAPWVIRPRALTLTLWARLLVCDFFVHGIGGAKYDRINDGIFRRYYGCEPPPYACVTATLRLPLPRSATTREDVLAARRRIRDLQFNPQRYLRTAPPELLQARQSLIDESVHLREHRGARARRREVWQGIRDTNAMLAGSEPHLAPDFEAAAARESCCLDSNGIADSREFFYALQPRARLEALADRLREAARTPGGSATRR